MAIGSARTPWGPGTNIRAQRLSGRSGTTGLDGRTKAWEAAKAADEKKAEDIIVMDFTNRDFVTDFFIVCTANNRLQASAIADNVEDKVPGLNHREGRSGSTWILLDYGDMVVHILTPESRDYYALEKLWGDAEVVNGASFVP